MERSLPPTGTKIEIMDTTLRDGEQTQGVSYTAGEKLNLAKLLLSTVGVDRLEVCSAMVSRQEKQALSEICAWAEEKGLLHAVEVLSFVDHKRSIDWVMDAGGRVVNLLTKGSLKHCEIQLRKSPAEHRDDIARTVDYGLENDFTVNAYLEDWSNGIQDSPDYVHDLTAHLVALGVRRIMLPDTLGVFQPDDVTRYVGKMIDQFPGVHFDFHPHNDYGLATANVLESVRLGVKGVHATVNCLGERAGNVDLAQVTAVLRDKLHIDLSINETELTKVSQMVEVFSGKRIAPNSPVVGKDVFTHTAGIHADGDKKGDLYSNALVPGRFGRRRIYALGKMSGKASVEQNLKQLGLELSPENKQKVLNRIVELADEKVVVSAEDLPFIIADVLEGKMKLDFKILQADLKSTLDGVPSAQVSLSWRDEVYSAEGTGDGGYDAFMDALTKILQSLDMDMPELVDYEVHIPPGGKTSALVETNITWKHKKKRFRTSGLASDQNMAAVKATERALNMMNTGRLKVSGQGVRQVPLP